MSPFARNRAWPGADKGSSSDFGIYKIGKDQLCRLMGEQPIAFRILPAFPPHETKIDASGARTMFDETGATIPPDAWVPFIDEEGAPFAWYVEIQVAPFVGHGDWKQRRDIVSRLSIPSDERPADPYHILYNYARFKASATWGYLCDRTKIPQGERLSLPFIQRRYLFNVVRMDQMNRVLLGELQSKSAADALFGENGLALSPNKHATDEEVANDYLKAYDNGDITDPQNGKVFVIEKDQSQRKGSFSPYKLEFASSFDRIKRRQVYQTANVEKLLAGRFDLDDVTSLVKIPEAEQQVHQIVELLNGRTPDGQFHEYALMKEAWTEADHPEWAALVPDPPARPGFVSTYESTRREPTATAAPIRQKPEPKPEPEPEPEPESGNTLALPMDELPMDEAEEHEPEHATVPVTAGAPVAGVAGERMAPAGDWRARYKAKFGPKTQG